MGKRVICFMLSVLLLFALAAPEALAAEWYAAQPQHGESGEDAAPEAPAAELNAVKPLFSASEVIAAPGETATMDISITNNPGILGTILTLTYDPKLTLVGAQSGEAFSELAMTKPGVFTSPCNFSWDGMSTPASKDGVVLTLTFQVSSEATAGEIFPVQLSANRRNILDADKNFLDVELLGGSVCILDYLPGDLNGDKVVDVTDIILMRRHLTGGYNVTVNTSAADVDGDGFLGSRDVVTMRQYVAGGYGVTLKPSPAKCVHELEATPLRQPTCTEPGNIAYWYCSLCGRYFSDAEATAEVSEDHLTLQALGHSPVIDAAKAPTETETGLTEGSHCEVCGVVIKAQEVVPVLEVNYFSITYSNRVTNGSLDYLNQLSASGKIENPNPTRYAQSETDLVLEAPHVAGYVFEGWYDGVGESARQITSIPAGSTGNKVLYARWKEEQYVLQFDSPLVPMADETYTVSSGKTLANPEWDGYVFVGWTDARANLVTNIPVGTTGNITLYANWISERNMTRPVTKLGDPIIYEDHDNNLVLFAYEIGTIENIPLFTLKEPEHVVGGYKVKETIEKSVSVSSTTAKSIASAVSKATTTSASWSLSSEWNEETHYDKTSTMSQQYTEEELLSIGKNDSGNWNISTGKGGTKAVTVTDGSSSKVSSTVSEKTTLSTEMEAGIDTGIYSTNVKVNAGLELAGESSSEYGATHEASQSTSKSWNTDVGYGKSRSVSKDESISRSLSQQISETTGYGKSYAHGESSTTTQGQESTDTSSREYVSTISYDTSSTDKFILEYSNENAKSGWYRIVHAGKAHVFAVVGYDLATRAYFTYTYSIMDDETYEYLDYSKITSSFDDYETGVLPFEVPYFVNEYVDGIVGKSDGLSIQVDKATETGTVIRYKGTDTHVVIPAYTPVDNGDGTVTVVKITGIASGAFQGNQDIIKVTLCDGITEIPDNAFEGCTSLRAVVGGNLTHIGANAFSGCTGISKFTIPISVTSVGANAFTGAQEITAKAANTSVVDAVTNSGAKRITIDLSSFSGGLDEQTLTIGKSTEYFEFIGSGQSFQNLTIISDAAETVIKSATLSSSKEIPLQLSSPNVTLSLVNISAPGIALHLSADQTVLSLFRNVDVSSSSSNAILSKSLDLKWSTSSTAGTLNAFGNVLICGTLTDEDKSLNVTNGEIKFITAEAYEQMLHSCTITFDANGGTCAETVRDVLTGAAIGALPVPTREYHTFDGWYDADGNQVTETTVFSSSTDVTLLAHWTLKPLSGWVLASEAPAGVEITDHKWTYNERTNTESQSTSLAGYTQYGSYWQKSSSGSKEYASFPGGFDTGNYIYTGFAKSGYSSYENATNKRTVRNDWAGYVYWHWMYNVSYANTTSRAISSKRGTYNGLSYVYFFAFKSRTDCPYLDNYYCNDQNLPSYNCHSVLPDRSSLGVGTPRFFRFNYYTSTFTDYYKVFQYYKIEAKESPTEVTPTDLITNVQHWVQYREV